MSLNVQITKISGGQAMRTDTMIGTLLTKELPEVGEAPIIINGRPLDNPNASSRLFNTSRLVSYEDTDEGRKFTTESGSVYIIKKIPPQ